MARLLSFLFFLTIFQLTRQNQVLRRLEQEHSNDNPESPPIPRRAPKSTTKREITPSVFASDSLVRTGGTPASDTTKTTTTPPPPPAVPQEAITRKAPMPKPPGITVSYAATGTANNTIRPVFFSPMAMPGSYKLLPGRGMHHLLRKIFSTYDKEVMPARPVVIHMDVLMLKVKSTVEKEGIFESVIALFVEWNDARMSWNPADYDNNVTILAFDSDKVWLPDIAMTNSADHLYSISRDTRFVVRVSHDGNFKFVPTGTARTWCELKLPTFPFDVQTCSLEFESWALDSKTMTFDGQSHLLIDDTFASQQWSLCSYKTVTYDHLYEFTGETFTRVRFDFTVKRKSMFYVLILIFPSTLLSLLQLLVFIIPSDNTTADRIGFGTTNLLTLVVFQTIVTEEMPKSSDAVTSLSKYIIALIIIAAVGICESVLVERLLRISIHPPPRMAMKIVRAIPNLWVAMKKRIMSSQQKPSNKQPLLPNKQRVSPLMRAKPTIVETSPTGESRTRTNVADDYPPNYRSMNNESPAASPYHPHHTHYGHTSTSCFCFGGHGAGCVGDMCASAVYRRMGTNNKNSPMAMSNEEAIFEALGGGSGYNTRRNSYFSALSRGQSTSFIVKLLKQQQQQQQNSEQCEEATKRKHSSNIEVPQVNRRKSSTMFSRSKQQAAATLTMAGKVMLLPKSEREAYFEAMRTKRERNLAQWAQFVQFLDLVTFAFCTLLALCIPVVLFLPLVYFDDRCQSAAGNQAHGQTIGNFSNALNLNMSDEMFYNKK